MCDRVFNKMHFLSTYKHYIYLKWEKETETENEMCARRDMFSLKMRQRGTYEGSRDGNN